MDGPARMPGGFHDRTGGAVIKKQPSILAGPALALASGALLIASFTPWSVWPLAWVALAPLFVALMKFAPTRAAFGAYCGLTAAVVLLGLIIGLPPGYEFVYAAPALVFGLVFLLTFWQKDLATRHGFRWFTALAATGITATEFARSGVPLTSFACLGLTQYTQPASIQIAALAGVYGVTFMLVTANCAVALIAANLRDLRPVLRHAAADIALVALLMGVNLLLLRQPLPQAGRVRVAAVQFGYVPEAAVHPGLEAWDALRAKGDMQAVAEMTIDLLAPLTRDAARRGARLVVWPETILDVGPDQSPRIAARLADLARETRVYLVAPYYEVAPADAGNPDAPYKNMAAIIAPDGRIIHRYHKQKYVRMAGIEKGPSGHTIRVADTSIGRLALMICYDADYPAIPAAFTAAGGQILLVPSHDLAGFLTRHHPSMEMFRSVENRRAMVKSDYVQGTLIMDPRGRILAHPPHGLHMVLADVPLVTARTWQPAGQNLFGAACCVLFLAFVFLAHADRKE